MPRKKRKPVSRMLVLSVTQPENHADPKQRYGADDHGKVCWPPMDEDGFFTEFTVVPYTSDETLADVALQQGMSPQAAAGLLRNLADRIERYGHVLLNKTCRDSSGYFYRDGPPVLEEMQWAVDDDGNPDYVAMARHPDAARQAPEGTFILIVKTDGTGYLQRATGTWGLQHCWLTVSAKAESAAIIEHLRHWLSIFRTRPEILATKPGNVWIREAGQLTRKRQAFDKIVPFLTGYGQPSLHIQNGHYNCFTEGVDHVYAQASENIRSDILIKAESCYVPADVVCDVFDQAAMQLGAYPDLLKLPDKTRAVFEGKRLRFTADGKDADIEQRVKAWQERYDRIVAT